MGTSGDHASLHMVSQFLKDLHPDLSEPALKDVVPTEVAVSYGRRALSKLNAFLALPNAKMEDTILCLKIINSILVDQERKAEAVVMGVANQMVRHAGSGSDAVRRLACCGLRCLAALPAGRQDIVEVVGLEKLTVALGSSPLEAAQCLEVFTGSVDGAAYVLHSRAAVLPALVTLVQRQSRPEDGGKETIPAGDAQASLAAVRCLGNLMSTDDGIVKGIAAGVPACIATASQTAAKEEVTLRRECARCLRQLCHLPDGKLAVLQCGGLEALAALCGPGQWCDLPLLERVTGALLGITICKEAKVPAHEAAATQLIALLRHPHKGIARNAHEALLNICEHPVARRVVEVHMSDADCQTFLHGLPNLPPDYSNRVLRLPLPPVPVPEKYVQPVRA